MRRKTDEINDSERRYFTTFLILDLTLSYFVATISAYESPITTLPYLTSLTASYNCRFLSQDSRSIESSAVVAENGKTGNKETFHDVTRNRIHSSSLQDVKTQ